MTFTHFLNCSILTYSPIYVIYSACSLSDYRIGKFFLWGIIYFLISSLVKMLLYATIIPFSIESEVFSVTEESLKIVINLVEVFFIILSLKVKNSFMIGRESGLKIVSVGLAWTLAENFISYFLYFLTNSMSDEFSWEFLQTGIKANIYLFERLALVAMIESYRLLKESNRFALHLVFLLILKYGFDSVGSKYFFVLENEWENIQMRGVFSLVVVVIGKVIFEKICVGDEEKSGKLS